MAGQFDAMQLALATLQKDVQGLKRKTGSRVVMDQHLDNAIVPYTSGKTANALDATPHTLGRTPKGVIVVGQSAPGTAYTAPNRAHTATSLAMASTEPGVTYQLMLY